MEQSSARTQKYPLELLTPVIATLDADTYNVGSQIRLRITSPGPPEPTVLEAAIQYEGKTHPPVLRRLSVSRPSGYSDLWIIPENAETGRYTISLNLIDPVTNEIRQASENVASFIVHRRQVAITSIEFDRAVYCPGDELICRAGVRNVSGRPLEGVRLELCDFHYPWIASGIGEPAPRVSILADEISLEPQEETKRKSVQALLAPEVSAPESRPFVLIAWDRTQTNVLAIAITPPVFISPHGIKAPKAYPPTQVYRSLDWLNTERYRTFLPRSVLANPIQFETDRTLFAEGALGRVRFSVEPELRGAQVHLRLIDASGREHFRTRLPGAIKKTSLKWEAEFQLPPNQSGLFQVWIELRTAQGAMLAANSLEIAANPLPRSILIFCAHQDDEMAHPGIIRAAAENQIPLDLVYLTNGDAGGPERYFQRICGPSEAVEFGSVRQEESKAALAHLGITASRVHFLGLPDGGCEEIWLHRYSARKPYWSVLLASDHAPYEGLVRPNLPYDRQSVTTEVKELIRRLQPQAVYCGHPDERHADHRATNWFVVAALQELHREGALPPDFTLLVDQSYGPAQHRIAPYRYESHTLHIPCEAMARIQEASWFYQSQGGNQGQGNTIPLGQLPREEKHFQVLDWHEHAGWNESANRESEAA